MLLTGMSLSVTGQNPSSTSVSGKVTETTGAPIVGAYIVKPGSSQGTVSGMDGSYQIAAIPGDSLRISFIGFKTKALKWDGTNPLNIVLEEDNNLLKEVVVVGYGTTKKENLTGAVSNVTSDVFENRHVTNMTQALQGVIPNLNIDLSDGKPTQSPSYNIRGATSIGQGGNALVLVDGVEGDPRLLNPNDIESISVLKDAASSSIYGARAAFGVVLITTKKAKTGAPRISYRADFTVKSPTETPDNITDSYPWAKGFADAYMNWNLNGVFPGKVNKTMAFSEDYLEEVKRRWEDPSLPRFEVDPKTGRYLYFYSTDWYKELYKDRFFATTHNVSLSGGSDKASYYLSARYDGQDGLYRYNTDKYNMYNLRSRGTLDLTKWLTIDNNTEYSALTYHQPVNVGEGSNIWRNIADEGNPLAPLTNPDGTLSFPSAYTVGDMYLGKNYADIRQNVFKNKIAATAHFLDDRLQIKCDLTYRNSVYSHLRNRVPVPYSQEQGVIAYVGLDKNDLEEQRQRTDYYAANLYADYNQTFAEAHNLHLLLGYNYESSTYKRLNASRNGVIFDEAKDINMALGENVVTTGGYEKWRVAGLFFRANYDYMGRYLLEVNGRFDGSSKFPIDQQWAFFPSVSGGWRISDEPFFRIPKETVNLLKLRASYGSLGNGSISPYQFVETFNISKSGRIIGEGRPQRTSQPGVLPESLTWERATTTNVGLDLLMFDQRLSLVADVYQRLTDNMYTAGPSLPKIFGAAAPKGNFASMRTTGWELEITWRDHIELAGKPFNYSIKGTLADSRSFITKYNNAEKKLGDYYVGQELGEIWGYTADGLFRSEEEIATSPSQQLVPAHSNGQNIVGDLKFKDLNNDNVISRGNYRVDDSGDLSIIGNRSPRYTYGITLNLDWSNIFLTAFLQGVGKQDWYPSRESRFWGQYNRPYNDYPRWQQDQQFRPEKQNFDAYLPIISGYTAQGGRALANPIDRYLQNVAYLRLKTLTVGYKLPETISSCIGAQGLTCYLSGENLLAWSPLYRITRDTDVANIWGGGSQLTGLNSDSRMSNDGYNYPMLRSVTLGITLDF